jgi:uroporphyrinogen decarboxylase
MFDLAHHHGAKVSHHCCGSSVDLIPRFIELGMDALQTIQPQAEGMNPYALKRRFGSHLTLHGAVDVQGWLQRATVPQIEAEVRHLLEEVGAGGGYILSPCHNIQPDTPIENVLALYRTAAAYRKEHQA